MLATFTKSVQVHDKQFSLYISAGEINSAVENLAERITADLIGKNPLFIGVLNGVFVFAADLLRKIDTPCEVSFIKVSSYEGTASTGTLLTQIGLKENIKGRTVVLLEDIIDTGNTIDKLLPLLAKEQPETIKIATLLFKPAAFKKDFKIDYTGIEIANDFVVGYGLDYNGLGRNLPDIYKLSDY